MYRERPPQVVIFVWYATGLGVLCAAIYSIGLPWQFTLFLGGLGCFALYRAFFYQLDADAEIREEHAKTRAILDDPNLLLIDTIGRLSRDQVELIKSNIIHMQAIPGTDGPQQSFKLPGAMPQRDTVSMETLEKFLSASSAEYCAPIRIFSDGTEREEATHFLDWLSYSGHVARAAAGNRPSAWKPGAFQTVCRQFGFEFTPEELSK